MFIIFSFISYGRIILVFILRYVSANLKGTKEERTIGQLSQMLCCLWEKVVDIELVL